jgi:hypothetical protein
VIFLVATPCNHAVGYQRLGEIYCLRLQGGSDDGGSRFLRNIGNHLHGSKIPVAAEWSALLIRIREIPGSNLGPKTGSFTVQRCTIGFLNSEVNHFSPEDGDIMFLRNVGIYLRTYTAPKPRSSSYHQRISISAFQRLQQAYGFEFISAPGDDCLDYMHDRRIGEVAAWTRRSIISLIFLYQLLVHMALFSFTEFPEIWEMVCMIVKPRLFCLYWN